LPSQISCTCSSQSVTDFSRSGTSLQGRNCATLRREISPADSSTFKCEEIVGCVSEKWPTRSDTDASPRARCTTIPRRVGSARAAKAWSSCAMYIDYRLYRWMSMPKLRSSFAIAEEEQQIDVNCSRCMILTPRRSPRRQQTRLKCQKYSPCPQQSSQQVSFGASTRL